MSSKIGDLLVKENLITQQQLKEALENQRVHGGRLGHCLIKLGFVTDDEITAILSRQYGVPSINLSFFDVDPGVVKRRSRRLLSLHLPQRIAGRGRGRSVGSRGHDQHDESIQLANNKSQSETNAGVTRGR
jgi:hypothetical protein